MGEVCQFGVDWEDRINFERLRKERVEKAKKAMANQGVDALLVFKPENIRYLASIRGLQSYWWLAEYALLPINGEPIAWQLGGELGRTKAHCSWLKDRVFPAKNLEGYGEEREELINEFAREIKELLHEAGLASGKLGIDYMNVPIYTALLNEGLEVVDGQPPLIEARTLKTWDEIQLIKIACAMADGALYECIEKTRPGMREYDVSAMLISALRRLGSEWYIRGIVASGEHTSPYYRTVGGTDKIIRPNDLCIIDCVQAYMAYWSDTSRTWLVGNNPSKTQKKVYQEAYEKLQAGIEAVRPGNTSADVIKTWVAPKDFSTFTLDFGHGVGITLHEAPWIYSHSDLYPIEFEPEMVLALETYSSEGSVGVRLEEVLVVTAEGYELLSRCPFDERLLK